MYTNYFGDCEIEYEGSRYVVTENEIKQLEREYIAELVYCNEAECCSLSWLCTSMGDEIVPESMVIVDDELLQKASSILGYELEEDNGQVNYMTAALLFFGKNFSIARLLP